MTDIPFLLTAYGIPYTMGYLRAPDGTPNPEPLSPVGVLDTAVALGLAGVELPIYPYREASSASVAELRDALGARNLKIVPDWMVLAESDPENFRQFLRDAAFLGATTVRVLISGILCGDRRAFAEGWDARLQTTADRLRDALPLAEDLGLCVAVENHQDATSDDLIRLHEMSGTSPAYGVCLDAGNPLAVGEGPVEFARRVAPLLRHLHLKDYTIHYAPEGYRLVRCAAGAGVVDFPALLQIARETGVPMGGGIEIAAQMTRTIPLLEDSWWACFPREQSRHLPEALRVLWSHGRPATEPYGSAWERGLSGPEVAAEEWEVLRASVRYFEVIGGRS
jgi:3-oxoisoapionate decarboxylase